jgi:hypothetical protein
MHLVAIYPKTELKQSPVMSYLNLTQIIAAHVSSIAALKKTIHLRRQNVEGGSPWADGQKVTVHKDKNSPS